MIYLWGLGSSLLAVGMEGLFIRYTYSTLFPFIVLPAIGINYCIYRLVQGAPNLVEALAVFALCNVVLRMGMSWGMGQPISEATFIVAALLVAANFVKALI